MTAAVEIFLRVEVPDVERRLDTAKCVLQVATERKEEKQEEGSDVKGSGRERDRRQRPLMGKLFFIHHHCHQHHHPVLSRDSSFPLFSPLGPLSAGDS